SVTVTNGPFPSGVPFAGFQPVFYQWYRDSGAGYVAVANQTNPVLKIQFPQASDSGNYIVIVTNYAGSVTSQVAAVTVLPDNDPPVIISAGSADGLTVGVCFDELLD